MFRSIFAVLLFALASVSNAAVLNFDSDNHLAKLDGSPLTSGIVRFGYFPPGTDFSLSVDELDDLFFEIGTFAISGGSFASTLNYSTTGTRTAGNGTSTLPYDLSPNNGNVTGDIAGEAIYAWVLDNSNLSLATQHAIYEGASFGFTWADNQDLIQDSFFGFGLDSANGMNALVGTASADPFTAPHRLASTIATPTVVSTLPANSATAASVGSTITVTFSGPVSLTAGAITVSAGGNNVAVGGLPATNVTSVVLTPTVPLAYGTLHSVTVFANGVTDGSSNNMEANFNFSFTTEAAIPPVITSESPSQNITTGSPATLTITATGTPTPAVQWYLGNTGDTSNPLSGETGTSLVLSAVNATASYWARVSNVGGFDDTETITLTATNLPFVAASLPADDATGVATTALIGITFSKQVSLTANAVTITTGGNPVAFTGLPVTNETSVVLTPTAPLQYGAEYVVTVVATEVTDIVPATMASNYVFNFTVEPPISPTFTDQPDSTTIAIGSSTQLSVAVSGTPAPTLQWYLGASGETLNPLSGETGTTLNTGNLSANTSYWVRATNLGGTTDSNTAVVTASNPDLQTTVSGPTSAFLEAVFDYTVGVQNTGLLPATGVTVTLTLPSGVTYVESTGSGFTSTEAAGVVTFTGGSLAASSSQNLTVKVKASAAGSYVLPVGASVVDPSNTVVELSDSNNSSPAAVTTTLAAGPPNQKPVWAHTGDLPTGQVRKVYSFKPALAADEPANNIFRSATSFSATGLPTGVRVNPTTGVVEGTPTVFKSTPYAVKVTARNSFGSAVLTTRLLITGLPTGTDGTFVGPIERTPGILVDAAPGSGALGGRIDFKVSSTGGVTSGKVTFGTKVYSFTGVGVVDPTQLTQLRVVANPIKRKGFSDLLVAFTIEGLTGTVVNGTGTISDGVATATFGAWRNPWSKTNRADAIAGLYTNHVTLDDTMLTSAQAPKGTGYLSFNVSATTGGLTMAGRLSDGSSITMATFAGPTGQMLLFRPLYGTKLPVMGSILGTLDITPGLTPVENTVSELALTWSRPANTASSNRLYRSGFPSVLAASVSGARYVAPAKPTTANPTANPRVMGLTDGANEIEVLLTGAGVEAALPAMPVVKANVSTSNKVTFSTTPNTRKVSLTFVSSKGTYSGKFTLVEPNPLVPTANVTRTVTYQGLIVKNKGEGYFILNQLPAVVGQTTSNSPQEGGKVVVQPVPVVP
jgi:uncharacterized repeat protein (TIGR01451 family)